MTTKPAKRVRCAVYTRVSTEYGLDQEFNSLDAPKVRQLSDGRTIGGIPFTRGPLAYLLRNRFYTAFV